MKFAPMALRTLLLIALLLSVSSVTFSQDAQKSRRPPDAIECQGKFYKVFSETMNWHEARDKCEQLGGRLAVVQNEAMNLFIVQLARRGKKEAYWLGATDEVKEGQWTWVTGEPLTYSNWGYKQPNNKEFKEHYLLLVIRHKNKPRFEHEWSDQPKRSVDHITGFICEWLK